jgi:hypothetical protein
MSLADVLPAVRVLSRVEKLRLIQFLADELAGSERVPELQDGQTYPVWSPHDAYDAAEVLLRLLEKGKAQP